MTIEEELSRMEHENIRDKLRNAVKNATLRAIETATDETPPNEESGIGTNALTGELKQHWATDSVSEPKLTGDGFVTVLANNVQYASYVEDGHRMDMHFVPGLVVNPAGGLDMNATKVGGLMVGVKKKYVMGKHMTDKAVETYDKVLNSEIEKITEEIAKND